jgi:type II secretory pathway pseudopilin PulG
MPSSTLVQTGYGQLELLFALVVVCAFLAVVLPLLVERIARRGY